MEGYTVHTIEREDAKPWIMKKHYAKRMPSISHSFGLFKDNFLMGIVTYGTPASSPLLVGVCGCEFKDIVIELNRLCLYNGENRASFLVGNSLKQIESPKIIVSFADIAQQHIGYVYQATNFIYTGLSAKRSDWKIKGKEHLHSHTIADEFRGKKNRSKLMREKYGDDFYLEQRSRKHRYIYFIGSKKQKKEMLSKLRYPILPYPKGESKRYDASAEFPKQVQMF